MRDLRRNQRKMLYALFVEKKAKLDANGDETGQYDEIFADPVEFRASVSVAKGEADIAMFGTAIGYDRVISTVQDLPIDENARIWVDNTDPQKPHDYVCRRVAKGLNQNLFAIEKVIR